MSKIVKFEQNLGEIWPKDKKVCLQRKFKIVKILQQNVSIRSGGGDAGGDSGDIGLGGGDGSCHNTNQTHHNNNNKKTENNIIKNNNINNQNPNHNNNNKTTSLVCDSIEINLVWLKIDYVISVQSLLLNMLRTAVCEMLVVDEIFVIISWLVDQLSCQYQLQNHQSLKTNSLNCPPLLC